MSYRAKFLLAPIMDPLQPIHVFAFIEKLTFAAVFTRVFYFTVTVQQICTHDNGLRQLSLYVNRLPKITIYFFDHVRDQRS